MVSKFVFSPWKGDGVGEIKISRFDVVIHICGHTCLENLCENLEKSFLNGGFNFYEWFDLTFSFLHTKMNNEKLKLFKVHIVRDVSSSDTRKFTKGRVFMCV